jgi:hypothetical protein
MTEELTSENIPELSRFELYRNKSLEPIKTLWNHDLNFAQNVQELIKQFVLLPNASLQLPIVTSLLIAPTPLCNQLPIGFCIGSAGSGKSTIAMIAAKIHGCSVLNASSSPASIRNECQRLRFSEDSEERIYMLIWDDLKVANLLDNPVVYSVFRGGYDRSTDTVTVASQDGINIIYRVFGARLVSSIEPFYNHPKMSELQRRTIPLVHCNARHFTPSDYEELGIDETFDISDKLDPNEFNWDTIPRELNLFWDESRLERFVTTRRSLSRSKKLKALLGGRFTICRDLICTSVASELFPDLESAVEAFAKYWRIVGEPQFNDLSVLAKICLEYIDETLKPIRELNTKAREEIYPEAISPKGLSLHISVARQNAEVDAEVNPSIIAATMRQLGFELKVLLPPSPVTGRHWVKVVK